MVVGCRATPDTVVSPSYINANQSLNVYSGNHRKTRELNARCVPDISPIKQHCHIAKHKYNSIRSSFHADECSGMLSVYRSLMDIVLFSFVTPSLH